MQIIDFLAVMLFGLFFLSLVLEFFGKNEGAIFYLLSAASSFLFVLLSIWFRDILGSWIYVASPLIFINMCSSIYCYMNSR